MEVRQTSGGSVAPATGERLGWGAFTGVALFAFALRAVYLSEIARAPLASVLFGDAHIYAAWAERLADGEGWGSARYYQTPLYPVFLALLRRLSIGLEGARWVQCALGSFACAAVAAAGARWFGRRVGLASGVLLAVYAPGIAYDGALEKAWIDVVVVAVLLAALAPHEPRTLTRSAALGVLLGAALLNRESLLLAFVVAPLWLVAPHSGGRVRVLSAFALGAALVLAASAWLNHARHGEFAPFRGQFGANLYMGNHAGADGLYVPLVAGHGGPFDEELDARRIAEAELGRRLTRAEISAHFADKSIAWMRAEPLDALALFARKLRYVLHDNEWADTHGYSAYRSESRLLTALGLLARFGVLVALAAYGLALAWPSRARWWPALALVVLLVLGTAVFFVFGRYRLVLVPLLAPFAGLALVDLARRPRFDRRRWVGAGCAALLAVSAFAPTAVEDTSETDTWFNLAGALVLERRGEEALRAADRALAQAPRRADLRLRRAQALAVAGRWDEARADLDRAVALDPSRSAQALYELGVAAALRSEHALAVQWFNAAVEADPAHVRAWARMGVALGILGRFSQAEAALQRAVQLDRFDPDPLNDLGMVYEKLGQLDAARAHYGAALALDPDHRQARVNAQRVALR
ncbi:MAG: tetratricopeptide repeat protein [Planctomycetes bacterium]|nr:tetratricopeptide repeat protein [Planctomycetota bacterium]